MLKIFMYFRIIRITSKKEVEVGTEVEAHVQHFH